MSSKSSGPSEPSGTGKPSGRAGRGSGSAPPIGALGMARWAWRQLTAMRTALILLFLLALGSVPGSLIPQRRVNPVEVSDFIERNPGLASWYDRFGLFDVFGSVWFVAIYLLLMVSLLGCILPRVLQHWRTTRARPPAAPRRFTRLPEHRTIELADGELPGGDWKERAKVVLRERRYRVVDDGHSLAAERGYLREWGNLVFHVAIVIVLVAVAVGNLLGFKGTALVVEGKGFANTITQYDGYEGGRFFDESQLPPFALTVKDFRVRFQATGEQIGAAREFDATVAYSEEPGARDKTYHLKLNHPLTIGDSQVHLTGHGYAPRFTVKDGKGEVAFSGPVAFLPQDGNFSSTGVVKAPDAEPRQLGFEGIFLPTAVLDPRRGPVSAFPDAARPKVFLTAYSGDLGLDAGTPQSVYQLDKKRLKQLRTPDGSPFRVSLEPGKGVELPGGGSVRFDGYERWVNLQISRTPGTQWLLGGAVLALAGLLLSLVVRRRRVWIRMAEDRAAIEVAGLDKTEGGDLAAEIDEITKSLQGPAEEEMAER